MRRKKKDGMKGMLNGVRGVCVRGEELLSLCGSVVSGLCKGESLRRGDDGGC